MKGKRESGAASRGVEWVALGVAAVVLALEIGRVLVEFGLRYTDEDQTIAWYAARDYAQLVFREPFFYGQSYNPLYECLPAALLVALGVEPWVATPVASAMIASVVWWLFAAMAWTRGARAIGVGLLVLPTAMASTYPMLAGLTTKSIGVAFVVAGLALVWNRASRARFVGFGWCAALGVTANPNSFLLALPVGLWALVTYGRVRRFYAFAGLGAALGLLLYGAGKLFYLLHPTYDLHRVKWFPPSLAWLLDGIQHLDRHWGQVSPLASGWLMLAALTVAALLHLRRRTPAGERTHRIHLAVGLCGVAVAVLSLALGRVHFGAPSVFFSYARMYVALPALLGFLVLLHAESNRPLRASAAICAVLAALAVVGGVYRHHRLPDVVAHALTEPARPVMPRVRDELFDECRRLDAAVPEDALVVFLHGDARGNGRAYGCGVFLHGRLDTLYPYYERRTWRLYEESRRPRSELFLSGLRNPCDALRGRFESCELVERSLGLFRIGFKPRPAISVLRQLGLRVRPFR